MMEERYHATIENRFYPDMSHVNKNITVEAKLISPPTYYLHVHMYHFKLNSYFLVFSGLRIKTVPSPKYVLTVHSLKSFHIK